MDPHFNYQPIPTHIQQMLLDNVTNGWFSCTHYHEGSCELYAFQKFTKVLRVAAKIYLPIHLVPLLLYRWRQIRKRPIHTLGKATYNFLKSVAFVGIMAGIMIYVLCNTKNIRRTQDWFNTFLAGFLSSMSLLLESHGRRHEIFLFGLPRGLDILGAVLKRYTKRQIPHFDVLVFGITIATLHYFYQHEKKAVKETVRKSLGTFWGEN